MIRRASILAVLFLVGAGELSAQQNRVDAVAPMAPELAAYGPLPVGVRTITATDRNRVDVLNTKEGGLVARYDRTLTIEVWYPAALASGQAPAGVYHTVARDPAPAEAWAYSDTLKMFPFMHYEDGVWDSVRSNNILQHFATAFLSIHLKGEIDKQAYLDVVPRGSEAVYSVDRDGKPRTDYTYWKGFKPRTATGLVLEHLQAGK